MGRQAKPLFYPLGIKKIAIDEKALNGNELKEAFAGISLGDLIEPSFFVIIFVFWEELVDSLMGAKRHAIQLLFPTVPLVAFHSCISTCISNECVGDDRHVPYSDCCLHSSDGFLANLNTLVNSEP